MCVLSSNQYSSRRAVSCVCVCVPQQPSRSIVCVCVSYPQTSAAAVSQYRVCVLFSNHNSSRLGVSCVCLSYPQTTPAAVSEHPVCVPYPQTVSAISWAWLILKPQQQPSQRYRVRVWAILKPQQQPSQGYRACVTCQETTAAAVSANSCVWRILKPQQQQSQRYCVCPFIKPQQHSSQRYRVCVCVCVLSSNDGLGRNRTEVVKGGSDVTERNINYGSGYT